ncbi:TetR/AcrR family transcriptional regulator [Gordonia westfalica]|uniref:TetR/AcrR family transcriptional regulator n=1 Tax=Gordonia westfalica TaxID=158898 RepID=A0ABU2GYT6_9ACTN|nr:TetR/AcrR family transcriptional regulator [Gordonia westfalica]MDS1116627.1 TetR/AcrR family transcriptional regulator [Gordonia westfalica]
MGQGKRAYSSPRREAQARETRARLAAEARRLFAEKGWAKTTLKEVAKAAGVAEPTVYAVFGNKAGLATALVDLVDEEADVPTLVAELQASDVSPRQQIEAMARHRRRMFDGPGDIVGLLYEGSLTNDMLAAAYRDGEQRGDDGRRRIFSSWPAGTLREGIDVDAACDVCSLAFGHETWLHLANRGWSSERIAQWVVDLLCRELVNDEVGAAES